VSRCPWRREPFRPSRGRRPSSVVVCQKKRCQRVQKDNDRVAESVVEQADGRALSTLNAKRPFMMHVNPPVPDQEVFHIAESRAAKPHTSSRAAVHTSSWKPRGAQLLLYDLANIDSVLTYTWKCPYSAALTWNSSAGDVRQAHRDTFCESCAALVTHPASSGHSSTCMTSGMALSPMHLFSHAPRSLEMLPNSWLQRIISRSSSLPRATAR